MKKDKKGFLLAEETLKIILAVIAIGFLAYLLFSIYFNYRENKDLEMAKASLEHLIEKINSGSAEAEIYNPTTNNAWYIASWPISGKKPLYCDNLGWETCLCICKFSTQLMTPSKLSELCDDKGVCMESSASVNDDGEFYIQIKEPPLELKINNAKEISEK